LQAMSEALIFADATAARCMSALARRPVRSERCLLGDVPFRLVAPSLTGGRWIGGAFLRADKDAPRSDNYELQIWDGISSDISPPPRPWGPMAHEPLGLIEGFCDETVRCAFDIH